MGFFPHVNRGDEFKPNAVLENNVRDMVNRFLASGAGAVNGASGSALHIPVWNCGSDAIPANAAVSILVGSSQ